VVDIITSFIFLVGLIFFVIPGIILILKYCMSGLVVLDKGAKPLEALKESNILTKDNRSSLLFLVLLAIIMNLGGILNTYFMKSILGNGNEIGSMLVMLIITAINVFFLVPMFSVAAVCAYSILKDTRTIQKPVGL
jgi:Na+/melibiose symporter-like transporter